MSISLTRLRIDLYKIVDQIIETGIPVEIERHGHQLRIVAIKSKNKLTNLQPHPNTINGDPEDIVHMDWYEKWVGGDNI